MQDFRKLQVGMPVSDIRHGTLGHVSARTNAAFRLDFKSGRQLWLDPAAIFYVDRHVVQLICGLEGLGRYAVPSDG